MNIQSWGKLPKVDHSSISYINPDSKFEFDDMHYLPYGLGRSYGDSCLNENGNLIITEQLADISHFDKETGILVCGSGISLKKVLKTIVNFGWFLPVVPGTQNVTIGGAIANDIHGKNHHKSGSFGNFIKSFELLRSDGTVLNCSDSLNADFFHATIGGMGLTGIILKVEIKLKRIQNALINTKTVKYNSLQEYWDISSELENQYEYTVSWIDCLMKNDGFRGVFLAGNHSDDTSINMNDDRKVLNLPFPITPPISLVNNLSLKILNNTYFKLNKQSNNKLQHYRSFFFPLDGINNWNNAYGKRGFFQYQFVIPYDAGSTPIKKILNQIRNSRQVPGLGVLKNFGSVKSKGLMSFPREGVTLALDFANKGQKTLELFNKLDEIVLANNGAIYPAKDARMSPKVFSSGYENLEIFKHYIDPKFSSSFWRRVNK
ncbi:FAD-binding oxidoreductase [Acidimicrobiia bacterium]|nr:FAD-binding oxidoreductase [Acidimicrobiia bacterium]